MAIGMGCEGGGGYRDLEGVARDPSTPALYRIREITVHLHYIGSGCKIPYLINPINTQCYLNVGPPSTTLAQH